MPYKKYSRSEDPVSHIESFIHQVEIQNATRSEMRKMFPSTLTDYAKTIGKNTRGGSKKIV